MKCPHCGKDIFPKQFRCDHCNKIVEMEYPEEKAMGKKTTKKEKK